MLGNSLAQFLGGDGAARLPTYPVFKKMMNKWLILFYILAVQLLSLFNFVTYVEGTNDLDISGNKSEIYQVIKKNIDDEYEKLRSDKITPWSFLHSRHGIKIKDYYGKEIDYSGIDYEGAPEYRFWNGFIEPFLKDIIFRTFDNTIQLCRDKKLYSALPIKETGQMLKGFVRKIYNDMADVDRRLRGKGYPRNISKKDVSGKVTTINSLIDERIKSELSASNRLNEFYHNNTGLIWLIGTPLFIAFITFITKMLKKYYT